MAHVSRLTISTHRVSQLLTQNKVIASLLLTSSPDQTSYQSHWGKMKFMKLRFSMFAALLLLLFAVISQAQVTAIKAGKLVDPETGTTSANQTIIVEGGKIKAIGPGLPVPAGATLIDLSNSTVFPGLFDAHTHMCQMTSADNRDLFTTDIRQPGSYRAILGVVNARMLESLHHYSRCRNNGNYADTSLRSN